MYFWTNTPNQVQFITAAAQVNKLRAYITDPSTSEEDAFQYAEQLIVAGQNMQAAFDMILPDWYGWLNYVDLANPKMQKSGIIRLFVASSPNEGVILKPDGEATNSAGETFYWEDFYRMIALICFFGRTSSIEGGAKHNPESYFDE